MVNTARPAAVAAEVAVRAAVHARTNEVTTTGYESQGSSKTNSLKATANEESSTPQALYETCPKPSFRFPT